MNIAFFIFFLFSNNFSSEIASTKIKSKNKYKPIQVKLVSNYTNLSKKLLNYEIHSGFNHLFKTKMTKLTSKSMIHKIIIK